MADIFKTQNWALKVPDSWTVDDSESAVVFVPGEDEEAALIVSAFFKSSDITPQDMRKAIEGGARGANNFEEAQIGEFKGYYATYISEDEDGKTAWRVWCVACGDMHLYVSII